MNLKKIDMDNLDELIKHCEDAMVRPLSKKKAVVAVEVKPDGEGDPVESDDVNVADDEHADKSDLSEMDIDDLLKIYQEMKDRG